MKILKFLIIILVIVLIIMVGSIYILQHKFQNEEVDIIRQEDEILGIKRVENAIMFFTVENCVNKYVGYLYNKDAEVIYNILDEEYKTEFNITKENIWDNVEIIDNNYIFSANDMYYEMDGYIEKYYVTGSIEEDAFDSNLGGSNVKEFNVTVILNMENKTFSIIPFGYGGMYYE